MTDAPGRSASPAPSPSTAASHATLVQANAPDIKAADYGGEPELPQPVTQPQLSRQTTNRSIHAQNSLRRMATHETGHGIDNDHDGNDKLETHDEDHEGDRTPGNSRRESAVDEEQHTEANATSTNGPGGKKEAPKLQDQTNLLPVKQVILVFVGLTCALFCSLIDQTM